MYLSRIRFLVKLNGQNLFLIFLEWEIAGITLGCENKCSWPWAQSHSHLAHKFILLLRIKGRELCDSYSAAWNVLDLKRDLRKRRDQMLSDPLDIVLDVIRGETWRGDTEATKCGRTVTPALPPQKTPPKSIKNTDVFGLSGVIGVDAHLRQ